MTQVASLYGQFADPNNPAVKLAIRRRLTHRRSDPGFACVCDQPTFDCRSWSVERIAPFTAAWPACYRMRRRARFRARNRAVQ